MFPTSSVLFLVAVIFIIVISWKIFKSVLKTALSVLGLVLLVGIIFGVVLVADAKDFQETIREEPTAYILADNQTVYSAFWAQGLNAYQKEIMPISKAQELLSASDKKHQALNHKVIVFSFESLNWSDFNESPKQVFSQISDEEVKATIFEVAFLRTAAVQGVGTIFKGVHEKTIKILPKTPIVNVLQFAPKRFATSIRQEGEESLHKVNETISDKLSFINKKETDKNVTA
ncbi:MAG: hypothetical protein ACLFNM_01765 [Candidatus Woesearchaeota archaeon]